MPAEVLPAIHIPSNRMKKPLILLLALSTLLSFSACSLVKKVFLGFRNVNEKTEEQLLRYASRKGLQTDNNYYLGDSATFMSNLKKFEQQGFVSMEVYDKNGYLLPPYDTADCPAPLSRYLNSICTTQQEPLKENLLSEKMKTLIPFKNNEAAAAYQPGNYDYTVILYWARFIGAYNKTNALEYERILRGQKDCKIHYFKVTLDPVNISRK